MDTISSKAGRAAARAAPYADDRIAYIRPLVLEGRPGYAIHTGDGTPIGWCEDRDVAFAAVRQQNLEPVSVH